MISSRLQCITTINELSSLVLNLKEMFTLISRDVPLNGCSLVSKSFDDLEHGILQ